MFLPQLCNVCQKGHSIQALRRVMKISARLRHLYERKIILLLKTIRNTLHFVLKCLVRNSYLRRSRQQTYQLTDRDP